VEPIVSGEVPIGGSVSCNDGLSTADAIDWDFYNNGVSNAWAGKYNLATVATGTWSLYAAFNNAFQQIDNVVVPAGGGVLYMPNAATVPPWPAANTPHLFLTSSTTDGWVLGTVTKTNGTGISPAITVTNGTASALASTVWPYRFFLKSSPGTYTLTANPGNANSSYVSVSSAAVAVVAGQVTSGADFVLPQGGGLYGFVTRDGVNPLPGIAITATDAGGLVEGDVVSAPDGKFRMMKWGRNKIKHELEMRHITPRCIRQALLEIDESDYRKALKNMLQKRLVQGAGLKPFQRRDKAARFAIGKGYEPDLVWALLRDGDD
jgi:hypothetical protein